MIIIMLFLITLIMKKIYKKGGGILKKLCFIYPYKFDINYISKDVGLLPKCLNEKFNIKIDFLFFNDYYSKNQLEKIYNDKKINYKMFERLFKKEVNKNKVIELIKEIKMIKYCFKNAKEYEYVVMFHFAFLSWFYIFIMKLINKNIKVFIKLDCDKGEALELAKGSSNIVKQIIFKSFVKKCDLISCETRECFNRLSKGIYGVDVKEKLTFLPNGIDKNIIDLYTKDEIVNKKENIIITVARLGEYEKNTELLVNSLKGIDLKEWKVYLIGTMTKAFEKYIKEFFEENPTLKEKLIFTGPIFNRNELMKYFVKSKCFLFTSRYESYGLVLNEANSYLNYIISTNVGAAGDIIENDNLGVKVDENPEAIAKQIEHFINNNESIMERIYYEVNRDRLCWNNIIDENREINNFFRR